MSKTDLNNIKKDKQINDPRNRLDKVVWVRNN